MQLFAAVPDFNEPIDALYICHENILKRMAAIETMAREILELGDPAFRKQIEIWREIFSFIDHSIANHTRDEEEGLFPLLAERTATTLDGLRAEHEQAEENERWLAARFAELLESPPHTTEATLGEFAGRATELAEFYRRHIAVENEMVFPAARTALSGEEKQALGELMRRHRNITVTLPQGL